MPAAAFDPTCVSSVSRRTRRENTRSSLRVERDEVSPRSRLGRPKDRVHLGTPKRYTAHRECSKGGGHPWSTRGISCNTLKVTVQSRRLNARQFMNEACVAEQLVCSAPTSLPGSNVGPVTPITSAYLVSGVNPGRARIPWTYRSSSLRLSGLALQMRTLDVRRTGSPTLRFEVNDDHYLQGNRRDRPERYLSAR